MKVFGNYAKRNKKHKHTNTSEGMKKTKTGLNESGNVACALQSSPFH